MCESITNCAKQTGSLIGNGIVYAGSPIVSLYNYLGKQVKNITKPLHQSVAKFIQDLYWTTPYAVALTVIPPLFSNIATMVVLYPKKETVNNVMGKHTNHMYAGVRNACIISAAKNFTQFVASRSPWTLLACIASVYTAFQTHAMSQPTALKSL